MHKLTWAIGAPALLIPQGEGEGRPRVGGGRGRHQQGVWERSCRRQRALDQKFVKVGEIDGEKFAVVESSGKLTGKMKDDSEPALTAELELKQTTWKSPKTGVAVREEFEGKINLSGTVVDGGIKTEMTIVGPISGAVTTKLIEKR